MFGRRRALDKERMTIRGIVARPQRIAAAATHVYGARLGIFIAAAALLATVAFEAQEASPAWACTGSFSGTHCYGVDAALYVATNTGTISYLDVTTLQNTDPCNGFISDEMWQFTQASLNTWVEVGVENGENYDQSCGNGDQVFWVEHPTANGPQYQHIGLGIAFGLGVSYPLRIEYVYTGQDWWYLYFNGGFVGASQQACCGIGYEAGTEVATTHGTTTGANNSLQKEINTSWTYGWCDCIQYDYPVSAWWNTRYNDLDYSY
jgi:hypothetical protein